MEWNGMEWKMDLKGESLQPINFINFLVVVLSGTNGGESVVLRTISEKLSICCYLICKQSFFVVYQLI